MHVDTSRKYARKVMARHLGRELSAEEHVHHKDENPFNNDLGNLQVLSAEDHMRHHYEGSCASLERGRQTQIAIRGYVGTTPIWNRESLIAEIRRCADLTGGVISRTQFDRLSTSGYSTIRAHFGSWSASLEAAGLPKCPFGPRPHAFDGLPPRSNKHYACPKRV